MYQIEPVNYILRWKHQQTPLQTMTKLKDALDDEQTQHCTKAIKTSKKTLKKK